MPYPFLQGHLGIVIQVVPVVVGNEHHVDPVGHILHMVDIRSRIGLEILQGQRCTVSAQHRIDQDMHPVHLQIERGMAHPDHHIGLRIQVFQVRFDGRQRPVRKEGAVVAENEFI